MPCRAARRIDAYLREQLPMSCCSRRSSASSLHRSSITCSRRRHSGIRPRCACGAGITCRARPFFATCLTACSSGTRCSDTRPLRCTTCRRSGLSSPALSVSTSGSIAGRRWIATAFCAKVGLPRSPVSALRLLGALPRQRERGTVRPALDHGRYATSGAGAAGLDADPGAAASGAAEGVGRRRSVVRSCGALCGVGIRSIPMRGTATTTRCYHSAAVVGLNTSAFLEGAIVGRPVFTTLLPEHHENQEGTDSFSLSDDRRAAACCTRRARWPSTSSSSTRRSRHNEQTCVRSRTFVEAFIRPHGIDVAATPVFVGAVETLGASRRRVFPRRDWAGAVTRGADAARGARVRAGSSAARIKCARTRDCRQGPRAPEAGRRRMAVKDALKDAEQQPEGGAPRATSARQGEADRRMAATKAMNKLKQRIKKRIGLAS